VTGGTPASSVEILFDLDDTLYPASAGLFRLVSERIRAYVARVLGVDEDEARRVQREYWRRYGTSLYGLMQVHGVEPEPFLRFVHDVPVEENLKPDPGTRDLLAALPARRHVFTNGPSEFAERVLEALGYRDLFAEIFDIRRAGFVPKPNAPPYDTVASRLSAPGTLCVLVEDALKNLPPARERGWKTVWLRSPESHLGGARGLSLAEVLDFTPDAVIDDLCEVGSALRDLVR
jgi:putative hydrolase of the HAD superfamily